MADGTLRAARPTLDVRALPSVPVPDLRPFSGLRYAPADRAQLAALLCPPYDVISSSERERLEAADPHNAVRLELPGAPAAGPADDAYGHAARLLDEWVAAGVLVRDQSPAIYVYEQRFTLSDGSDHVARSFFARLRLEPYARGSGVRPHELTMSAPKEDRFRLLSATKTNLSPVMLQYDDRAGGAATAELLDQLTRVEPVADTPGPGGVGQRLWMATADEGPAAARAAIGWRRRGRSTSPTGTTVTRRHCATGTSRARRPGPLLCWHCCTTRIRVACSSCRGTG